jgi:hypothetical protein
MYIYKYTRHTSRRKPEIALINPLNAKLIPICHLLALLGVHHILHVSGIRVNEFIVKSFFMY